jgi:hypothetical protein
MSMVPNEEPTTPAIKLFQSAHGKLITLQRINDQLSSILAQRQRVQDELRAIRNQIDEVFERELRQEAPAAKAASGDASGDSGMGFRLGNLENGGRLEKVAT